MTINKVVKTCPKCGDAHAECIGTTITNEIVTPSKTKLIPGTDEIPEQTVLVKEAIYKKVSCNIYKCLGAKRHQFIIKRNVATIKNKH